MTRRSVGKPKVQDFFFVQPVKCIICSEFIDPDFLQQINWETPFSRYWICPDCSVMMIQTPNHIVTTFNLLSPNPMQ
jgi:uncharacterized protein YlaI